MTLIFGKDSNLSNEITKHLVDSVLISIRDFLSDNSLLNAYKKFELNIIFNNFQKATALNNIEDPVKYISLSIYSTALLLEKLKDFKIKKIIYTSSSSVYGNNKLCAESDVVMPQNLHASLKLSNEYLISDFCSRQGIDYTIVRLFNMYGSNDKFSIISKIITAYKTDETLNMINYGESIRDYIHIEDVASIYVRLLAIKNINIINIGSGLKRSIKEILEFLKKHDIYIKVNNSYRDEIKVSIADNRLLMHIVENLKFQKVEDYILKTLKI